MRIKTMARRKWHESDREQLNADSARVRASAIAVLDRQISDLDQKIRNDPKDVAAIEARAAAFYWKGDHARAIADYDQLIDLHPRKATAWQRRCWVRAVANIDLDRAIADCNESLKLVPNNAATLKSRAKAFLKKGDYVRAISDYEKLSTLQPDNATTWNELCWARAIANRGLRQAIADCNVSLGLESRSTFTLDSRGFAYLRLGEFDQSIADYNAALRIDSRMAGSLYGRGLAKRKKGDIAGGEADVAAAREIDAHVVEEFASYGVK